MKILLSLVLVLNISSISANEYEELELQYEEKFYSISEVSVKEVTPSSEVLSSYQLVADNKSVGAAIMTAQKLLAFGKQIWAIIEKGRPVVNVSNMQSVSVLPKVDGQDIDTFDLANWNAPRVRSYRVEYKNGFNMTVIAFTYNVIFQYGGDFDGKGKYLTGVNVTASNVRVAWGFNFNASTKLVSISNSGSKLSPVASAVLEINYRAKSVMKDISSKRAFYVTGAGELKKLYRDY